MKFSDLRLSEPILRAVASEGYEQTTPIQAAAIPPVLEGRDVLGAAQTGTGKTAAFALPLLHRLTETATAPSGRPRPRCLVLAPTRELASQIAESFAVYGRHLALRHAIIYGGVNQNPQVKSLRRGAEIIVATPGRLQDLMEQGHVDLGGVCALVLDEADRMLDMGFIQDIRKIAKKLPADRQTLLFSATMPPAIRKLAATLQRDPVMVELAPDRSAAEAIDQSVYFVPTRHKPALLVHLLEAEGVDRALVFTRTKHGADRVVKQLGQWSLPAEAIHGNKTQRARERALKNFSVGRTQVLVATDIAARGIDVKDITHVINYDLTHEPETYVHRIGRTARAGAGGSAVSFCDHEEGAHLVAIERLLQRQIRVREDGPDYTTLTRRELKASAPSAGKGKGSRGGGGKHQGGSRGKPSSRHAHPAAARSNTGRNGNGGGGGGGGGGKRRRPPRKG